MSLNYNLLKALVNTTVFLEFSDENVIDPDIAVAVMEQIAADLSDLTADEKKHLLESFSKLSEVFPDKEKSEFVASLGDTLGI